MTIFTGGSVTPTLISNVLGGTITVTAGIGTESQGDTRTIANNGTFTVAGTGTSTFNDTFNNTGTLNAQSGTTSLTGGYSLTSGTLNFGLTSLSSFGEITLTGAAKLTGGLSANLNPSFSPIIGDSWQVLNYGSQTGIFTKTNLPPTAVWQTTYNAANTTIKILQFVPTITWATPAPIVYGTTLSGLLNATARQPHCPNQRRSHRFRHIYLYTSSVRDPHFRRHHPEREQPDALRSIHTQRGRPGELFESHQHCQYRRFAAAGCLKRHPDL